MFSHVISCYLCRFEYLQASSGKLVRPNLPPNHEWTGDEVQHLAGQGDIYIRPTYPFTEEVRTRYNSNLRATIFVGTNFSGYQK